MIEIAVGYIIWGVMISIMTHGERISISDHLNTLANSSYGDERMELQSASDVHRTIWAAILDGALWPITIIAFIRNRI